MPPFFGFDFNLGRIKIIGGTLAQNIVNIFKKRVLDANGIFEASTCLEDDITYLGANISSSNSLGYFYDASLLNTPNAYSQSVMYSIVPQSSSNGDLSFTRLSTATRINGSGQVETLGIDVPVLNYNSGSSCPTWKFGKELTNLFRDSEAIGGITGITYGSVDVNLDNDWGIGLSKKGAFRPGLESNTLDVTAGSSLIEGNLYTIAAFVRRTDGQLPVEGIGNTSTNDFAFTIAINNTSTAGTIKRDPIHVGNGVWFFQATIPAGNNAFWTGIRKRDGMSNDATEFSGIILVEGNVELDPSDYIPTNGSTITRPSDFSYTPNLISNGLISSGSGTMLIEFESLQGAPYYPLDRVSGSVAAYSLRKLSNLYTGSAIELVRDWDSASIDIGFNSNGDFDTTSALNWVYAYTQSIADIGGGATAAYSLRKVSENYTGSAIEVRRASDNASASFGFDVNGELDTGSLLTWTSNLDQYLLDYASGSAAAYSLRRLSTDYTGSAIEVRRSSDNASSSFGFNSNGDLDTGSLLSFVNEEITDNINTTTDSNADGLADGLSKLTNNPTTTIVTGNGHIGSAQRMEYNVGAGNLQSIGINTLGTLIGQEITVSFMYRSNISFSLGNGHGNAGGGFATISANTGDAIRYEHKGVWSPTGGADGRLQPMWLDASGEFIEISDWSITYHTADGHVKTWYDQSGNNYHATQTTNDYQPKIVNSGSLVTENGKAAIDFDVNDSFVLNSAILPITTFSVAKINQITKAINYILFNDTDVKGYFYGGTLAGVNGLGVFDGSAKSITGEDTNRHLGFYYYNGTQYEVAKDGESATALTSGANFNIERIGRTSNDLSINGPVQELILYSSDQSSNRLGIETNINSYYNIYTNPSESAFVKTWYDQSGNTNDATQTTNGNQPMIVNTGSLVVENGKPAIQFDGVNTILYNTSFSLDESIDLSGIAVVKTNDTATDQFIIASVKESDNRHAIGIFNTGVFSYQKRTSIFEVVSGIADTNQNLLFTINTTSIYINTVLGASGATTLFNAKNADNVFFIGGNSAGTNNRFNGNMQEVVYWQSNQSANRTTIETNINNYYNIYTASVENHGSVKTWYDQSGNNNHATQLTSSYQPLVISSGSLVLENGKAAIDFDGVDDMLQRDISPDISQPLTLFHVRRYRSNGTYVAIGYDTTAGTGYADINVANDFRSYYGSYLGTITQNTNQGLWYSLANGTSSEVGLDGAAAETGNAGTAGLEVLTIGSAFGAFDAPINTQEIIIYPSDQSSNRTLLETNLNDYYDIYPQSASINIITLESGSDALGYGLANESTKFRYLYKTNDINHLLVSQSTTLDRGVFKWDDSGVKIFSEGQLITSSSIVPTNTNWNNNLILNGAKVDFNLKQIMFFTSSLDDTTCANLSLYGSEWYKTFNQMANDLNYDTI